MKNHHTLYKSGKWQKLQFSIQVDLLSLLEGLRPGAQIVHWVKPDGCRVRFLEEVEKTISIIKEIGLNHHLIEGDFHFPEREISYYKKEYWIAKDLDWLTQFKEEKINTGQFLGYPNCCSHKFLTRDQEAINNPRQFGPAVLFNQLCRENYAAGTYPEYLDYRLAYIPCSLHCSKTKQLSEKFRTIITDIDPEMALQLKEMNRGFLDF